jgi:hypothetical protein
LQVQPILAAAAVVVVDWLALAAVVQVVQVWLFCLYLLPNTPAKQQAHQQ